MAPLSTDTVRQVLEEHDQLLAERADLAALLHRLMPTWGEMRAILDEVRASTSGQDQMSSPS